MINLGLFELLCLMEPTNIVPFQQSLDRVRRVVREVDDLPGLQAILLPVLLDNGHVAGLVVVLLERAPGWVENGGPGRWHCSCDSSRLIADRLNCC